MYNSFGYNTTQYNGSYGTLVFNGVFLYLEKVVGHAVDLLNAFLIFEKLTYNLLLSGVIFEFEKIVNYYEILASILLEFEKEVNRYFADWTL